MSGKLTMPSEFKRAAVLRSSSPNTSTAMESLALSWYPLGALTPAAVVGLVEAEVEGGLAGSEGALGAGFVVID